MILVLLLVGIGYLLYRSPNERTENEYHAAQRDNNLMHEQDRTHEYYEDYHQDSNDYYVND